MEQKETKEVILQNVQLERVESILEDAMIRSGACTCDVCKMDVIAIALNSLPPKYRGTTIGYTIKNYEARSSQNMADIYDAVYRAIELVNKNPHRNR